MLFHEEQQKAIEEIITKFNGDMATIIAEIQKMINAYFMNNNISPADALEFEIIIDQILTDAGYYVKVNQMIDSEYNKLFSLIESGFTAGGLAIAYTQEDLAVIQALKNIQLNKFSVLASTMGTVLRDNLYRYAISDYTKEDMALQILNDFNGTDMAKYSGTLAQTAIAEFQQSVIDVESKGLDGVWLYVGVQDDATRDFCNCVLNKNAYFDYATKIQIERDPQRRYNCRHRLRMVSEDYAKSQGFKFMSSAPC